MMPSNTLQPASAWSLHALLRRRQTQHFVWGVRDCAMLAFDAVRAVTGHDAATDLRGAYGTALQAWRLLRGMGGLHGMACARFGRQIDWSAAQDGDVALIDAGVCTSPAVFGGALAIRWRGLCVAQGPAGLVEVDAAAVRAAWKGR